MPTCFQAALGIHRSFRYLEAEDFWLDIRLPKAVDRRRKAYRIAVLPQLRSKPVAGQLKALAKAATRDDPLEWEQAWRALTVRALRVIDAAITEAKRSRTKPLKLNVNMWDAGTIVSSPIPSRQLILAVLPKAQKIASGMRRPGMEAKYATLQALFAWFLVLTGRSGDHLPKGDPHYPRGIGVIYVRWLERKFRRLLVKRGSASAWRRALRWRDNSA